MSPRTWLVVVVMMTTLVAIETAGAADAPPDAAAAQPVKFTKLAVKDPDLNHIEAVSFLIPSDWKPQGGVQWFADYAILANLLMTVTDPKTGAAIEFLPVQKFTHLTNPVFPMAVGSNYMGQIVSPPIEDPAQFLSTFYFPTALKRLQGSQLVTTEDLRKVAQQIAQQNAGSHVKATRLRYEYADDAGRAWEEDVYLTLVYTPWQMGTMWAVNSCYSFRAPKGELERLTPVMNTTISTVRLSLDWFAGYMQVSQLFRNRMQQGIRDATLLSQKITQINEEIRQMHAESYKLQCESQERISESFGEYIRGVETYKNPFEDRPVQLPAGYKDAWVNPQGEYVLSTDSTYNPNVGDTREWRRMEEKK